MILHCKLEKMKTICQAQHGLSMAQQTLQNCQWASSAQNAFVKWPHDLERLFHLLE
jgi:hypothetical protein